MIIPLSRRIPRLETSAFVNLYSFHIGPTLSVDGELAIAMELSVCVLQMMIMVSFHSLTEECRRLIHDVHSITTMLGWLNRGIHNSCITVRPISPMNSSHHGETEPMDINGRHHMSRVQDNPVLTFEIALDGSLQNVNGGIEDQILDGQLIQRLLFAAKQTLTDDEVVGITVNSDKYIFKLSASGPLYTGIVTRADGTGMQ
jgi:hypothetical protein